MEPTNQIDPKDGGYGSRKLWFSMFAVCSVILSGKILNSVVVPEVVMGIVAIVSIFVAGNAVVKWNNARFATKDSLVDPETDETAAPSAKTDPSTAKTELTSPPTKVGGFFPAAS